MIGQGFRHMDPDLLAEFIADCIAWIEADPLSLQPALLTDGPGAMSLHRWMALSDEDKFVFFQYALRGSVRGASLLNHIKSCPEEVRKVALLGFAVTGEEGGI